MALKPNKNHWRVLALDKQIVLRATQLATPNDPSLSCALPPLFDLLPRAADVGGVRRG